MASAAILAEIPRASDKGARIGAGRIGCTVEQYRAHEAAGELWCGYGRHWVDGADFIWTGRATRSRSGHCRPCHAEDMHRRRTPQRGYVEGLRNVRYAGPAYAPDARVTLTPEGRAVSSAVQTTVSAQHLAPRTAPVPSGPHAHCPAVLGCHDGRIPEGWIRARQEAE